mgnify:CR=1 FL=1
MSREKERCAHSEASLITRCQEKKKGAHIAMRAMSCPDLNTQCNKPRATHHATQTPAFRDQQSFMAPNTLSSILPLVLLCCSHTQLASHTSPLISTTRPTSAFVTELFLTSNVCAATCAHLKRKAMRMLNRKATTRLLRTTMGPRDALLFMAEGVSQPPARTHERNKSAC